MVSQSNELSSITTAKKLPRSSSEPKVDKHLKRESRALKSRSVHFDGTGMSNTICDVVFFLSKKGLYDKKLTFFLTEVEAPLRPISIIGAANSNTNGSTEENASTPMINGYNTNGVLETDLDLPPPPLGKRKVIHATRPHSFIWNLKVRISVANLK